METPKIIDLPKVVDPHLNGGHIVSYTSRYLTKPGDNYGSLMLAVTANVKRPNGEIEELQLVVKVPPLFNDLYWQIFQPERTCITENSMYLHVTPALRQLQLEAGIAESDLFDLVPRYYGSRISLDPSTTKVDRDAVLVQENLISSGYRIGNRLKLFDFTHTKLVLEKMAEFHALPIALRLRKPEVFDEKVRPYFGRFNINSTMGKEFSDKLEEEAMKEIQLATNNNTDLVERIKRMFADANEYNTSLDVKDSLYTTIVHNDLWINNMMIMYDEDGLPYKLKIVDFQTAHYESLVSDVSFFLFSSIESELLEQRFDELLRIYYGSFVKCLQSVGISTNEYNYEDFLTEVRRITPIELPHAIHMTKVILADNSTMPEDFKDMNMEVFNKNTGLPAITNKTGDIIRIAQKFNFL